MNIYSSMRMISLVIVAIMTMIGGSAHAATAALTANTTYIVTLEKFLSDGTLSTVSSTTVTSDANGKISFTFSNVPTCPTTNFLSVKVADSAGTVVRRSFSPAPPANTTNSLGANGVSTKQGEAMVEIGTLLGSDDPFAVLFGLMFTRTDTLTANDISQIAIIGREGIINGMEPAMTANGVTAAVMTTFKNKLVCGNTGKKDLSNFTALFKTAVDTPAQAQADMAKAAGLLADIVIDAAEAAGIDLDVILAAFDDAGDKVNTGSGATAMAAMSASVRSSMNQSVQNFSTRIGVQKVQQRYAAMLTTLGVSGAAVTRFNSAVTTLGTAMANIDTTYAKYFDDPVNFPMTSAIQTAIDNAFTSAFTTFQTSIASTNAEIGNGAGSMRAKVAAGMNAELGGSSVTAASLSSIGTYRPFGGGAAVNWPIPQTGAVNFIADALVAGGSLAYSRTTLAIPTAMTWLGGSRSAFSSVPSASFRALLQIQEDLDIAEFTRFAVFTGTETAAQRKAAKLAFKTNVANIVANITGTTNGTTNYTAAQKRAIVLSNQKPSLR